MSLEDVGKHRCVVWDFPDLLTRFVTEDHPGLTLTPGWTQFVGLVPRIDGGTRFDLHANRLTIGSASFTITDVDKGVSQWLADNDDSLAQTPVTRKQGLVDESEAGYTSSMWVFEDYGGSDYGEYQFDLTSVLKPMSRGLFDEFDGDSRTMEAGISDTATSILLEDGDYTSWRQPGYAILTHKDSDRQELIAYTAITSSPVTLTGCTRARYGVGGDPTQGGNGTGTVFIEDSDAIHVWVIRDNPVNVMMRLLTTTDVGTNGEFDAGDGDGLGIDVALFDVTDIKATRDAHWPDATFAADGSISSGVGILLVEGDEIDDLKEFIEDHLLRPYALKPQITAGNLFAIETYYRVPPNVVTVGDKWSTKSLRPGSWSRNLPDAINKVRIEGDWNTGTGKYAYSSVTRQDISRERYTESKVLKIQGRGGRSGRDGFPDYGSDTDMLAAAALLLLEVANPWTLLKVKIFYEFRDIAMTDTVEINLPGILDVISGERGLAAKLFFVDEKRVDDANGVVSLRLRERRPIGNPAFIAANNVDPDYGSASESDRQFCYICEGLVFDDGTEAYTVA